MDSLAILILTGNEEKNITKCLRSIEPTKAKVYIIDSFSDDRTVEIARSMGATVLQNKWTTHAGQFNWGLDNAGIDTDWVMRMDADEEITTELAAAIQQLLDSPPANIDGLYVRRRVYFMGQWIRHGGYYPTWLLRLFRNGKGRCEPVVMDEHIVVSSGRTGKIEADIIDNNNKGLTFWIDKHNKYATLELEETLEKGRRRNGNKHSDKTVKATITGNQDSTKRWLKDNIYLKTPLFVRPSLYFIYRYFIRLGILDGTRGLIFHFLQAFWYRFLVDAKLYEHRLQQSNKQDT